VSPTDTLPESISDAWRYALVGGVLALPPVASGYWLTGSELSASPVLLGGIVAGGVVFGTVSAVTICATAFAVLAVVGELSAWIGGRLAGWGIRRRRLPVGNRVPPARQQTTGDGSERFDMGTER